MGLFCQQTTTKVTNGGKGKLYKEPIRCTGVVDVLTIWKQMVTRNGYLAAPIRVIKELPQQFYHAMPRGRAIAVVPQLATVTGGLERLDLSSGGGNLRHTAKRKARASQ